MKSTLDPLDVYAHLLRSSTEPVCFLEGANYGKNGRFTFVCSGAERKAIVLETFEDIERFDKELSLYSPPKHKLLPYSGGPVGFIGYEITSLIEKTVETNSTDPFRVPKACFYAFRKVVAFDHVDGLTYKIVNVRTPTKGSEFEVYTAAQAELNTMDNVRLSPPTSESVKLEEVTSNMTPEEYYAMVRKAKSFIKKGDIFQVVLSQRFSVPYVGDGLMLYRNLRAGNPSPYMFHMRFGKACRNMTLVGSSPEVMAEVTNEKMRIRPIAGTERRGNTPEEDARLARKLITNEKELAEHRMLVDLARNDIGRYCEADSIMLPTLMQVENYSRVMHIVSEVVGKPLPEVTPLLASLGLSPAGTLSGAPKIRAMQIIALLEKTERGPYGGAFGFVTKDGAETCILIRSAMILNGTLSWQSGGGIVADSTEDGEYNETLMKAQAVYDALRLVATTNGNNNCAQKLKDVMATRFAIK
ncbi:MAG: chorismate-binding protein [bacterium]|nr:chorismate-binding protein [bacterium]